MCVEKPHPQPPVPKPPKKDECPKWKQDECKNQKKDCSESFGTGDRTATESLDDKCVCVEKPHPNPPMPVPPKKDECPKWKQDECKNQKKDCSE